EREREEVYLLLPSLEDLALHLFGKQISNNEGNVKGNVKDGIITPQDAQPDYLKIFMTRDTFKE
ncbi:hypothetical protein ILYODFUR_036993, partial [Ilyodon furcidens]